MLNDISLVAITSLSSLMGQLLNHTKTHPQKNYTELNKLSDPCSHIKGQCGKLPLRNPLTKAIASMICCKGNNSLPLSRVCMNVVWPDESVYNIFPFTYRQSQMSPSMSKITMDPWHGRQVWWFLNVGIPELMAMRQTLLSSHSHIPDQSDNISIHSKLISWKSVDPFHSQNLFVFELSWSIQKRHNLH